MITNHFITGVALDQFLSTANDEGFLKYQAGQTALLMIFINYIFGHVWINVNRLKVYN